MGSKLRIEPSNSHRKVVVIVYTNRSSELNLESLYGWARGIRNGSSFCAVLKLGMATFLLTCHSKRTSF